MRKGQVTLFIIIATVLLIFAAMIIMLAMKGYLGHLSPWTFDEVKVGSIVSDCIKQELENGLHQIGMNGGKLVITDEQRYQISPLTQTNAYSLNDTLPTISTIKADLAAHIDSNLLVCLNDFTHLKRVGYSVKHGAVISMVDIFPDSITVTTKFPVTVTRGEKSYSVNNHRIILNQMNLKTMVKAFHAVHASSRLNPGTVDLTVLASYPLETTITPFNGSFFYNLVQEDSYLVDGQFHFRFVIKYI